MTADNAGAAARNRRKTEEGVVRSVKMDKTIVVDVVTKRKHPKYEKFVTKRTRYHAHDEDNSAAVGDKVEIMATRPMSKTKRWRLVRILKHEEA
ncbi:MAG: 30S ribosomal protein S17 [Planctomycetota bacterium]